MRALILPIAIAATVLGLIILANSTLYQVDQRVYALHLRFGEVKEVREQPGLYLKLPLVDSIQNIDKRTLRADIPPRAVPDRDRERLIIDTVIRYRIKDPLAFRKSLRTEATALQRLQNITYSAMRDTVATYDRIDIIGAAPVLDDGGAPLNDAQGLPVYQSLVDTRDQVSRPIQDRITRTVTEQAYGIEIISADMKRADFPPQIRESIVDKLSAERHRVAARHRADGEEQYRIRTASVQAEADILLAEARRDARTNRGEGEAAAIALVEEALGQDPAFYDYLRTLESYETTITPGTRLVIGDQASAYLKTLASGQPQPAPGTP